MNRWLPAMRQALAEAALAKAHGDVPIGAVVLGPDGAVLASAHNERELTKDPSGHAELLALRRLTTAAFGTLMALEPAIALLVGLVVLAQVPRLAGVIGIALVVVAGVGAERTGARAPSVADLADA